jgi:MOSC domain-containing protein YiiM
MDRSGLLNATVCAVSRDAEHGVSKAAVEAITLVAGLGVEGDAHAGEQVQHLFRMRRDPTQPNLRQVHLIHAELHDELRAAGFEPIAPGQMGENVTTRGIDLLALPAGALLRLGTGGAVIEVKGLRNPCRQLDGIQPGLMAATLARTPQGALVRKAGVMAVVVAGGVVRAGDRIELEPPATPRRALEVV